VDLNFPQAEAAVLGAILIDPDKVMPVLAERLRPEDFADATLRHLFEAARGLWLDKKPVDAVTIGAAAGAGEEYARVAQRLMTTTPTAANAEEYAGIVRQRAQLREIQSAGLALSQCGDIEEARELISRAAQAMADRRSDDCRSWREVAAAYLESLDAPAPEYLDLGIQELTKVARVQAGKYVILGAYNSVGKTALALQMAWAMARAGKRVGFFSLETQDLLLAQRIFAQQTGTRLSALQDHRLRDEEARSAVTLAEQSYGYELEFFNASGYTAADIRARTLSHRLDVVFIDYVQLVAAEGESPALQLRGISMELHGLAQQTGVTVVALSQVTLPQRDNRGRRPPLRKENLRESQQLANDADVILLLDLTDPDDYDSNRVLVMDKNKDVGRGRMLLAFDGPRLRFSYLPPVDESRERTETLDKNQEERRKKREAVREAREAQESAFREMEGGAEGLPF